jgi:hypothetical protein
MVSIVRATTTTTIMTTLMSIKEIAQAEPLQRACSETHIGYAATNHPSER